MKILSKSSANLYLQCPYKWKKCYIDKIRSKPSLAQWRGINIHRKIERFYKNMEPDPDLQNLIAFERKRIESCKKNGKVDKKYFFPLFQELKMQSKELGLRGIVDAVFINPEDDGIIIIDWKTGRYYGNKLDDYRFELAVYAELLKASGKVDEVKYWGIYFTDADKLFFEKIDSEYIRRMYETIKKVREGIASNNFPIKRSFWCKFCQFKGSCGK